MSEHPSRTWVHSQWATEWVSKDLHFTSHLDHIWPPLPVGRPPKPNLTPPTLLTFHCQHTTPRLLCGRVFLSIAHLRSPPSVAVRSVVFDRASCWDRTCYDPVPVKVVEDDSVMIRPLRVDEGGGDVILFWSLFLNVWVMEVSLWAGALWLGKVVDKICPVSLFPGEFV